MELHTFKNVNSCWYSKIYFFLMTSVGYNSNIHLTVVDFFNHCVLDIRGSLTQLFSCIGVYCILSFATDTIDIKIYRLLMSYFVCKHIDRYTTTYVAL